MYKDSVISKFILNKYFNHNTDEYLLFKGHISVIYPNIHSAKFTYVSSKPRLPASIKYI